MKKTKIIKDAVPNKKEIEIYKESLKKSCDRIFTLKLAVQGLVGHLPEYVVDKLVEIAGEISCETTFVKLYGEKIKSLEEENE